MAPGPLLPLHGSQLRQGKDNTKPTEQRQRFRTTVVVVVVVISGVLFHRQLIGRLELFALFSFIPVLFLSILGIQAEVQSKQPSPCLHHI